MKKTLNQPLTVKSLLHALAVIYFFAMIVGFFVGLFS